MGGGGGYKKSIRARENKMKKKIHARQLTQKNIIHATAYKKFTQGIW